jgi:hypothetical protein
MMRLSNGERADEPPGPVSVRVAVEGTERQGHLAPWNTTDRDGSLRADKEVAVLEVA